MDLTRHQLCVADRCHRTAIQKHPRRAPRLRILFEMFNALIDAVLLKGLIADS